MYEVNTGRNFNEVETAGVNNDEFFLMTSLTQPETDAFTSVSDHTKLKKAHNETDLTPAFTLVVILLSLLAAGQINNDVLRLLTLLSGVITGCFLPVILDKRSRRNK